MNAVPNKCLHLANGKFRKIIENEGNKVDTPEVD